MHEIGSSNWKSDKISKFSFLWNYYIPVILNYMMLEVCVVSFVKYPNNTFDPVPAFPYSSIYIIHMEDPGGHVHVIVDIHTCKCKLNYIDIVTTFAKKTGDYAGLSHVDMKVMALTYQLECELGPEKGANLKEEPQRTVSMMIWRC
jgi:hypothetical protein